MASTDATFDSEIFRKDHPMILASRRDLASIKSIKLAYDAGGYKAGQVLALNTVTGYRQDYVDGQGSGIGTADCVLLDPHPVEDFSSSSDFKVARGVFGGELNEDLLTGLDAAAKVDLKGRTIVTARGTNIFKF